MRRTGVLFVVALLSVLGASAVRAQDTAPPTAADVLARVVERYLTLQTLQVEGQLAVTKQALGFVDVAVAEYSLLFRRPLDVLYQLKSDRPQLRHTLQCFKGVVRDYYAVFGFEGGSTGEALLLSDPPKLTKDLDLSPLLERVLLAGVEKDAVQEVVYTGPGDEEVYEIGFVLFGPPLYEDGPRPRARVTLNVNKQSWLLNGYKIEALLPEAVSHSGSPGQEEMTDYMVIVEAVPKSTFADETLDDALFAYTPPPGARVIDQRGSD